MKKTGQKHNLPWSDNSFAFKNQSQSQSGFLCVATVQTCKQSLRLLVCYNSAPSNWPYNLESSWLKTLN